MPQLRGPAHQASRQAGSQRSKTGVQRSSRQSPSPSEPVSTASHLERTLDKPDRAFAADIVALQQAGGNRAVQRLLSQRSVQPTLTVGPAHDAYEQEADRATERVMQAPTHPVPNLAEQTERVQRSPAAGSITPAARRAPTQTREVEGEGGRAGATLEAQLTTLRGTGHPLPASTRRRMESGFGADFDAVRVHTGARADSLNRSLNAQAFTHGTDVYFGASKYNPHSSGGQRLLAHELAHVVQQTGNQLQRRAQPAASNKQAARFQTSTPAQAGSGSAQRKFTASVQRKLMVKGEAADKNVVKDQRLNKGQKMALEGLVDDQNRTYRFKSLEDLVTYLGDVRRDDLVEIEDIQAVEEPPEAKKPGINWGKGIRAVLGGLVGTIFMPLTAAIGGIGGAVRGAMGGAKSVWNKLGRGNKHGGLKFLAGLAAAGGALAGMVRGAITGTLAGAMAGPATGALLAAPELADENEGARKNEPKIATQNLQPGDILLVRGGGGVSGGMIQFGQYLHQLWSGAARGASTGFRHAGVYIGSGNYAHASGGIFQDGVPPGVFVYRSRSNALAERAAKIARKWSTFRNTADTVAEVGYSAGKAGDAIFRSSSYSKSRAGVLAAYFAKGITPGAMFCSEFAISVYQAAALLPAINELKREAPAAKDKGPVKDWVKDNKARMKGANHGLMVDPRHTAPQMLAAELQRQSGGDDPTWQYLGVVD